MCCRLPEPVWPNRVTGAPGYLRAFKKAPTGGSITTTRAALRRPVPVVDTGRCREYRAALVVNAAGLSDERRRSPCIARSASAPRRRTAMLVEPAGMDVSGWPS